MDARDRLPTDNTVPAVRPGSAAERPADTVARLARPPTNRAAAVTDLRLLVALQRLAGNRAVAKRLRVPWRAGATVVQRDEHEDEHPGEEGLQRVHTGEPTAVQRGKWPRKAAAASEAKTSALFAKGGPFATSSGFAPVPKSKAQRHEVNGVEYKFWNDADGCIDFKKPLAGCPAANIMYDVNIDAGGGLMHDGKPLKQFYRTAHYVVANQQAGEKPLAASPKPGYLWHHHKDVGRMQLIDAAVHGAFRHKGGFSIWGS